MSIIRDITLKIIRKYPSMINHVPFSYVADTIFWDLVGYKLRTWSFYSKYFYYYLGNIVENPMELINDEGIIRLKSGLNISFNRENKEDVLNLLALIAIDGIELNNNKPFSWKFDPNTMILTTPQGINFYIKFLRRNIFAETFLYDIHFTGFNLQNKTVITAGSFIGDTALYFASNGARVYAFEANPDFYSQSLKNIELNPKLKENITIRNWAIQEDGEIDFYLYNDNSSSFKTKAKNKIKVKSVSLSTILKEFEIDDPYLLDIDIKGSEYTIFKKDLESIKKFHKLRIEYLNTIDGNKIYDLNFISKNLEELGFNIRYFKHYEGPFSLNYNGTIYAEKKF